MEVYDKKQQNFLLSSSFKKCMAVGRVSTIYTESFVVKKSRKHLLASAFQMKYEGFLLFTIFLNNNQTLLIELIKIQATIFKSLPMYY